ASQEVYFLEKNASHPLIYYVPEQNLEVALKYAHWLYPLSCEVSSKSVVAFAAESQGVGEDWARGNPLFASLAKMPVGRTRLMPFVDVSQTVLPSGLLSDLPFDFVEST